jgi:hypothetical protein
MMQTIIAVISGLLLLWFIFFAFRQGMKVSPDDRPDRSGQTNYGGGGGDT